MDGQVFPGGLGRKLLGREGTLLGNLCVSSSSAIGFVYDLKEITLLKPCFHTYTTSNTCFINVMLKPLMRNPLFLSV